jgi:hypothetical protein
MQTIKNLKFDIMQNISLNLGIFVSSLSREKNTIEIRKNDVSEIILAYQKNIRGVHCELADDESGRIEKVYFPINRIRDEKEFISLDIRSKQ